MNKITIIMSDGLETGHSMGVQLSNALGPGFSVKVVKDAEATVTDVSGSLVLLTDESIVPSIQARFGSETACVTIKRKVDYSKLNELLTFLPGTEVLLVNNRRATCEDTIQQLQEMGLKHISYEAYYPGITAFRPLAIAVSPGEGHLSPKCVKRIHDIGIRKIDVQTFIDIFSHFGTLDNHLAEVYQQIQENKFELSSLFVTYLNEMNSVFETIVNSSEDGVAYLDRDLYVTVLNKSMSQMLQKNQDVLVNRHISEILPGYEKVFQQGSGSAILEVSDENYYANLEVLKKNEEPLGYLLRMKNAREIRRIDQDLRQRSKHGSGQAIYTFPHIVGHSPELLRAVELTQKVANSNSSVLFYGESGTGKELFAQAMHNHSTRRKKPFIPVNFAAMTESLMESELFGYEEGAFTGAKRGGKIGLFEEAQEGTIFLDEIGDASLELQIRLLRTLQERCIRRVGGTALIPIDVRVVAATNKDLLRLVRSGKFREDLYYRINVVPILLPPLRERKQDIPKLLAYYVGAMTQKGMVPADVFAQDALAYFEQYSWPGNVRELSNVVEYAINVFAGAGRISLSELPFFHDENHEAKRSVGVRKLSDQEAQDWILEKMSIEPHCGRRRLATMATEEGLSLTEAKIKVLLAHMEKDALISVSIGAGGCRITEKGMGRIKG